MKSQFDTLAS